MNSGNFLKGLLAALLFALSANLQAQFLRTSYFMEGSHYRQQLNPALAPGRGYINIPVIGSFNMSVNSSSLGYQDILDIVDNSNDADFFTSDKFMNRLSTTNSLQMNLSTDIISAGWYKGKNFWSFNVGLRADMGASIPKSMFQFMREMNGLDLETIDWANYNCNVGKEQLEISSYAEIGLGFARDINSRLTVGGRVKALLGIGNLKLQINELGINTKLQGLNSIDAVDWNKVALDETFANEIASKISGTGEIAVEATLESSFKGLELRENEKGYIDEFEFESSKLGIAGCGFGIDLGASYKLLDNLTVSAAVLDLGFIKWSKGSTSIAAAKSSSDMKFDFNKGSLAEKKEEVERFANLVSSGEVLNYDMLQLTEDTDVAKSRTSSLNSTLVVGAEYALLNNWLVVGALSTTRFTKPKTMTELTLSANVRPKNYLNLALSYSMIQSAGKSFGLAVKLGPLFLGTDYMFLGKNSKSVNGFLGISIPLNKKKKESAI